MLVIFCHRSVGVPPPFFAWTSQRGDCRSKSLESLPSFLGRLCVYAIVCLCGFFLFFSVCLACGRLLCFVCFSVCDVGRLADVTLSVCVVVSFLFLVLFCPCLACCSCCVWCAGFRACRSCLVLFLFRCSVVLFSSCFLLLSSVAY